MRVTLIILLFVVQSFAGDTNATLFSLTDVLPSGRCDIELMTIEFSDRANELALKMQAAVATNQDWFMEQVKKTKPGEPLDYDPRLGVTKEEWVEFLKEGENRHLASTGTRVPCTFHRKGNTLSLDVGDTNSPLSKIRLDMTTGELFASVGRVGTPTWSTSNDSTNPIGAYDACSWQYEKGDLDAFNARIAKLEIWRLRPSGKILWRFKDSEVVDKQLKQSFEVLFQHPAKGFQSDVPASGSQPIRTETNRTSSAAGSRR